MSGGPDPSATQKLSLSLESIRVKIYFFLEDLWKGRGGETEEPWAILEELLQRKLGTLKVGQGPWPRERLKSFIISAKDQTLLDLIELVPRVEETLYQQSLGGHAFRLVPDDHQGLTAKIAAGFNSLLSETECPARFSSNGMLERKGWPHTIAGMSTQSVFPRPIRAKIFLFLCDYWAAFKSSSFNPWSMLQDVIMRELGILEVGHGYTSEEQAKNFVLEASDGDILQLLEIIPYVEYLISHRLHQRAYSDPFQLRAYAGFDNRMKDIVLGLNPILAESGSPARFDEEGILRREGFAQSEISSLSNLPSKQTLREDLNHILERSGTTSVLMIDLDGFKAINDSLGHLVADQCLDTCTSAIQASVLFKGKVYRYGGDEMVVLLRNYTAAEAFVVAERIRSEIATASFPSDASLSASIGVACTSDLLTVSYEALLQAADNAMYESKRAGGNRITIYQT